MILLVGGMKLLYVHVLHIQHSGGLKNSQSCASKAGRIEEHFFHGDDGGGLETRHILIEVRKVGKLLS